MSEISCEEVLRDIELYVDGGWIALVRSSWTSICRDASRASVVLTSGEG